MLPDNVKIVIPARRGSKGFPFKNRKLLQYTLNSIPKKYRKMVWITTDDEKIIDKCRGDYNVVVRPKSLAQDNTPIWNSMFHLIISNKSFKKDDIIIMLYLTYPDRKWKLVLKALKFFKKHKAKSLLCKIKVDSHPYLMMYENGINGRMIVSHNKFRRQDYPEVFELSHCVCIFKVSEIQNLGRNLWNNNTVYFPIKRHRDVDYKNQYK